MKRKVIAVVDIDEYEYQASIQNGKAEIDAYYHGVYIKPVETGSPEWVRVMDVIADSVRQIV